MTIAAKIHDTERGAVVAACDMDILGKRLTEGKLTVEVSKEFYFEKNVDREELLKHIDSAVTANLIGEKAVGAYCKKNPHAEDCVILIAGVPHLQVFEI